MTEGESLSELDKRLGELESSALAIISRQGSAEPDLGRYLGQAHVGEVLVLWPRFGAPVIVPMTSMEREEAARSGLEVLDPEQIGLGELQRSGASPERIWARAVLGALEATGTPRGRLAFAGSGAVGVLVELVRLLEQEGIELVSGGEIAQELRRRKTAFEIAEIERVTAVVGQALLEVAACLAGATSDGKGQLWRGGECLRVGHLREAVRAVFCRRGLHEPKGNIFAPGREGGVPHNAGEDESSLVVGESLVVDLFPKGRLFSDVTRTFCVGKVPEPLQEAHQAVRGALELVHRSLEPGIRGWTLQEKVCEYFRAAGFAEPIKNPGTTVGYVHNLGHGVGYELHEAPSFRAVTGSQGMLAVGDVVTLEPGLYQPGPGGYGVRLEDVFVLDEKEVRCLTRWPYDLDPRVFLREMRA